MKRVLVARFMSSVEEMQDANTRIKKVCDKTNFLGQQQISKPQGFYLKNSKAFDNLSKRSQDQLTDQERGAISEKDVPQNLAEDSWTVSSKFK